MSDRELLEKAARAAGIDHAEWVGATRYHGEGLEILDYVGSTLWNPLENDGDAFRLMVDCNLYMKHSLCMSLGQENDACDGKYRSAFRRAIVRAAAAVEDSHA